MVPPNGYAASPADAPAKSLPQFFVARFGLSMDLGQLLGRRVKNELFVKSLDNNN